MDFTSVVVSMYNGLVRAMMWIFGSLINVSSGSRTHGRVKSQASPEASRQAGCRDVVLYYANHFGYVAREAITKAEIEKVIDVGIEPADLSKLIQSRIDQIPGIELGEQMFRHHTIKLPFSGHS